MQKQNKNNNFNKYQRSHHFRLSALAIAAATGFHLGSGVHFGQNFAAADLAVAGSQGFHNEIERENETARHAVRYDDGMRLPSTSGSTV